MCSFLVTTLSLVDYDIKAINNRLSLRGPDATNLETHDSVSYLHNLLSITGDFTPQPFVSNCTIITYNGEIYNSSDFGSFKSDGYALQAAYDRYGSAFAKYLDGEYAICIYDRRGEIFYLVTDTFATKPLFFAVENNHIAVSSYYSAITELGFRKISRVPANTCVTIERYSSKLEVKHPVYRFTTDQYKTHYDDWIAAFKCSIQKRSTIDKKLFLPLSSGYDSGAIACELVSQNSHFKTFSFFNNENTSVLSKRLRFLEKFCDSDKLAISASEYSSLKDYLVNFGDDYTSFNHSPQNGDLEMYSYLNDPAAIALAYICKVAQSQDFKICLSGQGADEIMSDYSLYGQPLYSHSNFCGVFPRDLNSIFPWPSFYGSTQASYLLKEEFVAGAFGIETRYPFLDRMLVQEYLSLSVELKNNCYKAPLSYYLLLHQFPFSANAKHGFSPL